MSKEEEKQVVVNFFLLFHFSMTMFHLLSVSRCVCALVHNANHASIQAHEHWFWLRPVRPCERWSDLLLLLEHSVIRQKLLHEWEDPGQHSAGKRRSCLNRMCPQNTEKESKAQRERKIQRKQSESEMHAFLDLILWIEFVCFVCNLSHQK